MNYLLIARFLHTAIFALVRENLNPILFINSLNFRRKVKWSQVGNGEQTTEAEGLLDKDYISAPL